MSALFFVIAAAVPPGLMPALEERAPVGARVELVEWSAPKCDGKRFEPQAVERSGRIAVHVTGRACHVWGWATVRLTATQAVLTKALNAGDALEGAYRFEEREWTKGLPGAPSLEGASAARRLQPGTLVRETDVRFGPPPGTAVTVRVQVSSIRIEQRGTITPCGKDVCASLPNGKRISGTWADGVLVARTEGEP